MHVRGPFFRHTTIRGPLITTSRDTRAAPRPSLRHVICTTTTTTTLHILPPSFPHLFFVFLSLISCPTFIFLLSPLPSSLPLFFYFPSTALLFLSILVIFFFLHFLPSLTRAFLPLFHLFLVPSFLHVLLNYHNTILTLAQGESKPQSLQKAEDQYS